ncbi:hypothetical protein CEXT_430521 [Caerostris extrusa]|uniref:Uncharacterized protein n=1 Tax=Caerostris extrusa TaxID=172846 RepID=A0AAV4XR43_CAEEX|nr:hypothetical protein CEXT_430521 [Caerostris extrusa]
MAFKYSRFSNELIKFYFLLIFLKIGENPQLETSFSATLHKESPQVLLQKQCDYSALKETDQKQKGKRICFSSSTAPDANNTSLSRREHANYPLPLPDNFCSCSSPFQTQRFSQKQTPTFAACCFRKVSLIQLESLF